MSKKKTPTNKIKATLKLLHDKKEKIQIHKGWIASDLFCDCITREQFDEFMTEVVYEEMFINDIIEKLEDS